MKKLSGTWPNLERNEIDRGIDCATRPILTTRLEATPPNCLSLGPERKCARASTETLGPQLRRGINGDADQVFARRAAGGHHRSCRAGTDARTVQAILSAPAFLSGLTDEAVARLRDSALQALHPKEVEEIAQLEAGTKLSPIKCFKRSGTSIRTQRNVAGSS